MIESIAMFLGTIFAKIIQIAGPDIIKLMREINRNTAEDTNPSKDLTDRLNDEIKKVN